MFLRNKKNKCKGVERKGREYKGYVGSYIVVVEKDGNVNREEERNKKEGKERKSTIK